MSTSGCVAFNLITHTGPGCALYKTHAEHGGYTKVDSNSAYECYTLAPPTLTSTLDLTSAPTGVPTDAPTQAPTVEPTDAPTFVQTEEPTPYPTPAEVPPGWQGPTGNVWNHEQCPHGRGGGKRITFEECMNLCEASGCNAMSYRSSDGNCNM